MDPEWEEDILLLVSTVLESVNSDNMATSSDGLQEDAASITTTSRSRLLDEMKGEESRSDCEMDMSDEKEGKQRVRRRMKFMKEKEACSEHEKETTPVEETGKIRMKRRQARGGNKQLKKFRAMSREEKRQTEQNIRYRMAHGLLSRAPLHATAKDPPEKVGFQIVKRLKEPNVGLIKHIVLTVGSDRAIQLLRDTEDCIAEGGIMTSDGRRRRTAGGTFLTLLKTCQYISDTERAVVFTEEKRMAKEHKRHCGERKKYLRNLAASVNSDCQDSRVPTIDDH